MVAPAASSSATAGSARRGAVMITFMVSSLERRSVLVAPLVVLDVALGDEVGLDHDRDVHRVELVVDHGPVADESAEPQIALDQRRQALAGPRRIECGGVEP